MTVNIENHILTFLRDGRDHDIEDIYQYIENHVNNLQPTLCVNNCSRGHNQPEWRHAVRRALDRLKNRGLIIHSHYRFWRLH